MHKFCINTGLCRNNVNENICLPEQEVPDPVYPVLQAQEKEPAVLLHVASE